MEFAFSCETDREAYVSLDKIDKLVERFLVVESMRPPFDSLSIKVRYVPIVMGDRTRARYPARSRVRRKEKLFDCAPQLDHETFVTGSHDEQLAEYLHGLRKCATALPKLGATADQVKAFLALLRRARTELAQVPPA